jgi:hypothetical protein
MFFIVSPYSNDKNAHTSQLRQSAPAPVVEAKKESLPPPAPVPAPAAPAPSTGGALGSVKGQAPGGRKLEAETVSADTLDFLKKYQ